MLRLVFVFAIIATGLYYSLKSPFYALLFYIWNAYFRPDEWVWNPELIRPLHLSFCVGAYLVFKTAISQPKWRFNLGVALMLLFFIQSAVGTIASEHFNLSWNFLSDYWKVFLISYFIIVLVDDKQKFRLTLMTMALSLGLEAAKQGWVGNIRFPGSINNNPISFLGDNNGVAMGTLMLAPILVVLAQTAATRWERYMHQVLAVGVVLRGISTYSRGGFLSASALGVMTFIRSRHKLRTLIGVVAVSVLVWFLMPQQFWDRMNTILVPEGQREASSEGRLHFWDVAVNMADAKPLTGVGLNAFSASFQTYNASGEYNEVGRAAHSSWFGVLADLGYPGLVLFLANFIVALWSCRRIHRAARGQPDARELGLYANAIFTSIITYAVAASFLSQQYNEMYWHFVALSTTLGILGQKQLAVAVPATRWSRSPSRPVIATGLSR